MIGVRPLRSHLCRHAGSKVDRCALAEWKGCRPHFAEGDTRTDSTNKFAGQPVSDLQTASGGTKKKQKPRRVLLPPPPPLRSPATRTTTAPLDPLTQISLMRSAPKAARTLRASLARTRDVPRTRADSRAAGTHGFLQASTACCGQRLGLRVGRFTRRRRHSQQPPRQPCAPAPPCPPPCRCP